MIDEGLIETIKMIDKDIERVMIEKNEGREELHSVERKIKVAKKKVKYLLDCKRFLNDILLSELEF